jgi:hypothetical protein
MTCDYVSIGEIVIMGQTGLFGTDRTCPKCKKQNALSAETAEEELEQEQIHVDQGALTYRYTRTLFVNVSCKYCSFTGSTTLSKSTQGGSRADKDGSVELWGAQDYPVINPDAAIQIVVERVRHPRYRRTAPW